jgi:hypothetical protein
MPHDEAQETPLATYVASICTAEHTCCIVPDQTPGHPQALEGAQNACLVCLDFNPAIAVAQHACYAMMTKAAASGVDPGDQTAVLPAAVHNKHLP